jgi:hypothetical protein
LGLRGVDDPGECGQLPQRAAQLGGRRVAGPDGGGRRGDDLRAEGLARRLVQEREQFGRRGQADSDAACRQKGVTVPAVRLVEERAQGLDQAQALPP